MSVDASATADIATPAHVDTRLEILRRFMLAILDDATLLEQIPDGTNLYLLPEEDPEFAARERAIGEAHARRGRLVTLLPIRLADLPE